MMKADTRGSVSAVVATGVLLLGTFGPALATWAARTTAKAKPPGAKIAAAQAVRVATTRYHGRVVGKVPLENEEGRMQYAVTIRSGKVLREVMVNANTGKIDSAEVTTAAKERAEERANKANVESKKTTRPASSHKSAKRETPITRTKR